MRAETISEQLFFTTCHLAARSPDGNWVGTGFIYAIETTVGTAHFLVTNKHVLQGAANLTIRLIQNDGAGAPLLGKATQITVTDFSEIAWVGHPDPKVDVAVMSLHTVLTAMEDGGAPAFFRSVSPELCLGVGSTVEFDALEEVTFIGYPSGLFDSENFLPIARKGTTATPIEVDYEGSPAFLIDASVFPGSSGSPVFIVNKGMHTDRAGNTTIGSRIACIGVLAAVHTRPVEGEVENVSTRLVASFNEPIDLGVVYKSRCFDECAQVLIEGSGLVRVTSTSAISEDSAPSDADATIEASGQ